MGFIERLRQQKEAEALVRNQREVELGRKREAEEAARQQREIREREFHAQRKQQAEAYFQESGVETLITELAEVTGKFSWGGRLYGRFGDAWFSGYRRLPSLATDPDSVSFGIVWDELEKGRKSARIPLGASVDYGKMEEWSEFEGKFFAVETHPDGNIIFHARRDITVPKQEWKSDKGVIEVALEQTYNLPRIQKYNGNFIRSYPD